MKMTLTQKQKQELENQHDKSRDGRVRDRIKTVLLASARLEYLHDFTSSAHKPELGISLIEAKVYECIMYEYLADSIRDKNWLDHVL